MKRIGHLAGGLLAVVTVAIAAGCTFGSKPQANPGTTYELLGQRYSVETVASDLRVPWALAWTPDGRMLVTERPGRLRSVDPATGESDWVIDVEGVTADGEHGLMGMALSPTFAEDRHIFLSYTTPTDDGTANVIVRYRLGDGELSDRKVLVGDLPAADYHDGLPLRFGSDGKLYASTGDATQRHLAQQKDSLAGKFLRIDPDGSVPEDNPFGDAPIWTLGHRNSQGFDWHPETGLLYATEHGPSLGVEPWSGGDELNLVSKGDNYGWPLYHHDENGPGYVAPLRTWSPAIAPAGGTFYDGAAAPAWRNRFFFAGLRGQALWCVEFSADQPREILDLQRILHREFGRLRAVEVGPDGLLYFTTSNRDGRGSPASDDDRVLRLVPVDDNDEQGAGD